jgi:hypothetical protein
LGTPSRLGYSGLYQKDWINKEGLDTDVMMDTSRKTPEKPAGRFS